MRFSAWLVSLYGLTRHLYFDSPDSPYELVNKTTWKKFGDTTLKMSNEVYLLSS